MNASLKDQLKDVPNEVHEYGRLPQREYVLVVQINANDILPIWDRLNGVKKNLRVLSRYIETNKGEGFADWVQASSAPAAQKVLTAIGNRNNDTGGVSAYYYDLQRFFDSEEQKYDDLESTTAVPNDIRQILMELRFERNQCRTSRKVIRKVKMKELKDAGKGEFPKQVKPTVQAPNIVTDKVLSATGADKTIPLIPVEVVTPTPSNNLAKYIAVAVVIGVVIYGVTMVIKQKQGTV